MDVYGFKILWAFSSALTVCLHLHHSGHHSAWERYTPSQLRPSSVCGYWRARCPDHSGLVLSPRGVHRSRSTAAEDEWWVKLNNPDGRGSPTTVWSERSLLKTLRGRMLQDDACTTVDNLLCCKKEDVFKTSHYFITTYMAENVPNGLSKISSCFTLANVEKLPLTVVFSMAALCSCHEIAESCIPKSRISCFVTTNAAQIRSWCLVK